MKQALILTAALCLLAVAPLRADTNKPAAGESFQIESVPNPGQLLRVRDASSTDGTPMVLYPNQAWRCMTWELQTDGDGVRLRNLFTKKSLRPANPTAAPANKDAAPSSPVVQRPLEKTPTADEAWRFVPVEGKPGLFNIEYIKTGLVLEAADNGNVVATKKSDSPAQQWRLLPRPEHFTG